MDLRQIALVAEELAPVRQDIFAVLGIDADFADKGVAEFGLENSVMTIGRTFLEVVAPVQENTTAGRLLARRQGDGGYMVIAQVGAGEIEAVSARMDALGIRKVWQVDRDEVTAFHLHPRDIGAAIVSFDEMRPAMEWLWAGPGWRQRAARHVTGISGVTLQAEDPESIAARWSAAFDRTIQLEDGAFVLQLDNGEIRIEAAKDGRGDGVAAVRFETPALDPIMAAAAARGISCVNDELLICGTRFQFREAT
jgi:hypothetical protein